MCSTTLCHMYDKQHRVWKLCTDDKKMSSFSIVVSMSASQHELPPDTHVSPELVECSVAHNVAYARYSTGRVQLWHVIKNWPRMGASLHLPEGLMDPLKTYQHNAQNVLWNWTISDRSGYYRGVCQCCRVIYLPYTAIEGTVLPKCFLSPPISGLLLISCILSWRCEQNPDMQLSSLPVRTHSVGSITSMHMPADACAIHQHGT